MTPKPVPLTAAAPTPAPGPPLPGRMAPPVLSPSGGTYQWNTLPTEVILTNPNPDGGQILVARQWSDGGVNWEALEPEAKAPCAARVQATLRTVEARVEAAMATGPAAQDAFGPTLVEIRDRLRASL